MLDKRYDFKEREKKIQEYWGENKVYRYDPNSSKETYSIDTPPPTVSGSLHIGHIFSYTQAEIIARFHRMQGKNVFYPFGFDDNGLPTERLVEKEAGISANSLKRSDFTALCMGTTKRYEQEFKALWTQMGFSVDWELQYETINPLSQRISQKSFLDLARKGKAYLKETPVLYCTHCQTSIAQADLEPKEGETTFNTLPFLVEGRELLIATTRPELLYGCVAIFVHPEDSRYKAIIGKTAKVPLYNFDIPILTDAKVSPEKGTGAVMCATFGDTTDLEWFHNHKLPYKRVINPDGILQTDIPYVGGLPVKRARQAILQELERQGLLLKQETITHTVSIHERCGHEIEIIPSKQWFIDILSEKERFLRAADEINWYPESMKQRYLLWVENLKWDWCISRQRYFGVPFPVWYCKSCGAIHLASDEDLPLNPLETSPDETCPKCGSTEFTPESAVLDTWATSSVTPLINSRWGEADERPLHPMSMRTQAHEIIRTWAFYTIVKSLYHTGQIPWKDIMVCGFVMAKQGEKFSKSKDNAKLSPHALIETYSSDGLRYWAASGRLGTDTLFAEEELKTSGRFLTKLWNASRFCLMHLEDYDGQKPEKLLPIDQWIIEKGLDTLNKARKFFQAYEAGAARQEIDSFFWNDFCDQYLEIVKDRLYKPEIHGAGERRSAQYALYLSLLRILKLYAPFVPHITEEIYLSYFKKYELTPSLHLLTWDSEEAKNPSMIDFGQCITAIMGEVRRYKSERNLSLKAEIDRLRIQCNQEHLPLVQETLKDLEASTGAKSIELSPGSFKAEIV
ncbi:MAG: valine--tRNA ligase [Clostridia bacterium]|nr:valine--tRNA ligase [Clostridia bacterium]